MDSSSLLWALIVIALVDSINPSAIAMTFYILAKAPLATKSRALVAYVCGIFSVYSILGIVLAAGLDVVIKPLHGNLASRVLYGAQAIIGIAMITWAFFGRNHTPDTARLPKKFTVKAMFMLGMFITTIELSTAFPYFAAIALLRQSHAGMATIIGILMLYNVIFILPPLVILAVYRFSSVRFETWSKKREVKRHQSDDAARWIVGIIGAILALNAVGPIISPR